jgi:single-strand DNA-binding protein
MMEFEGVNFVELQGELCWPELKYTSNAKALLKAKLRIPIQDQKSGELRDSYLRITAWEEFAEYLDSLPQKSRIRASARIQQRSYDDRNGNKKRITELIINGVELVESEEGKNGFHLRGQIKWPELKQVGEAGTNLFSSKVVIPFYREDDPSTLRSAYVPITAWQDTAEQLSLMPEGTIVDVTGHVEETSREYNGQNRVFTNVVVTNVVPYGATA